MKLERKLSKLMSVARQYGDKLREDELRHQAALRDARLRGAAVRDQQLKQSIDWLNTLELRDNRVFATVSDYTPFAAVSDYTPFAAVSEDEPIPVTKQIQTAIDTLDDVSADLMVLIAYLMRQSLVGMEVDVRKLKSNVDTLIEYWRITLAEGATDIPAIPEQRSTIKRRPPPSPYVEVTWGALFKELMLYAIQDARSSYRNRSNSSQRHH